MNAKTGLALIMVFVMITSTHSSVRVPPGLLDQGVKLILTIVSRTLVEMAVFATMPSLATLVNVPQVSLVCLARPTSMIASLLLVNMANASMERIPSLAHVIWDTLVLFVNIKLTNVNPTLASLVVFAKTW